MHKSPVSKITLILSFYVLLNSPAFAQSRNAESFDPKYVNWHNKDPKKDNVPGMGVDRVYMELLQNKQPKKEIVVAVIDSGVDIYHEDLEKNIWTNADEIAGNGMDDDKNGYVDDIHGWNFIGNKKGENISFESMEITRLYAIGFGPDFSRAKELYEAELAERKTEKENIEKFEVNYNKAKAIIKDATGISVSSAKDLDLIGPDESQQVLSAKRFLESRYERGFEESMLAEVKKNNQDFLDKFLNPAFDQRHIIGDDPIDITDVDYGNADVKGPRSDHGTSVAGVIAAIRDNNLGIQGIAAMVKIMVIRSTPRGDERDKDVALAIKYAVDNGAHIINMSFGKPMSPQKKFVDDAVKHAESKGVLMVHGAGNNGENIDEVESYPSDRYLDGTEATNWINVGATGAVEGEELAARFSNYGKLHVDVFAPGENIISTDSSSTYNKNDGTSLAAPMVAGVAALVLSYYPELSCQQLISILMESSYQPDGKVRSPGFKEEDPKKVRFSTLSKSGGIVNAYEAMKLAERTVGR